MIMMDKIKQDIPIENDTKALKGDITKILEEIKLPEKRSVRTSGDIPIPQHDTSHTQTIAPEVAESVLGKDVPHTESVKRDASIVVPLRTLRDDMSAVIQSSKISLIRAVSLEEDKKKTAPQTLSAVEVQMRSRRTRHTLSVLFVIILLIGIGSAALLGVYTITNLQQGVQAQPPNASILFAEHSIPLVIDHQSPEQIKQILATARVSSAGSVGSITRITPIISVVDATGASVQTPATLTQFLHALGAHVPDDLTRALGDNFVFGIHAVDKNAPVMIIPVISYSRAFAGMLAWESTMNTDLAPVFTPVPAITKDVNGLPVSRTFVDAVMNNYDVRELKDDAGNVMLYYSFPSTQILVIAESPYSFTEILSRLQAGRKL
jgi:hypothetical protein